jgi:hypothetical protein
MASVACDQCGYDKIESRLADKVEEQRLEVICLQEQLHDLKHENRQLKRQLTQANGDLIEERKSNAKQHTA